MLGVLVFPVFATVTITAHRRPAAAFRFKYAQGFSSLTQAEILLLGSHSFSSLDLLQRSLLSSLLLTNLNYLSLYLSLVAGHSEDPK